MVKILNAWESGSWVLPPISLWVHVGRTLGQFQPLLSLLALLQLSSSPPFSPPSSPFLLLLSHFEFPPFLTFLCHLLFSSPQHETPSRSVVEDDHPSCT